MSNVPGPASKLFEDHHLGRRRGALHWWLVVPLAYALSAFCAVAALSIVLTVLRRASMIPPPGPGLPEGYRANALDALLLSPLVETLLVAMVLKAFLVARHVRFWRAGFIVTIGAMSWWAHGASTGALYPAVGFAVFADCLMRGWTATPPKKVEAIWAATAAHALLNVPHVVRYWPW